MRRAWVIVAVVIGLQMGVAAQSEPKSVMPAARLEQARFELEHLDGDRNAMPDPARWPLSPTPATDAPRMLLFNALPPTYLADHAAEVAKWGFRGFLIGVGSWSTDVWAVDGNPATRGQVRISSNDEAAVWLDGKPVWVRNIDADIAPVTIPAGTHPLLVKICNRGKTWEFCLRLTDNWGLPLAGVRERQK